MHSSFTILDNHFLSNDECNDIKNKLLQNKGYWQKTHVKYFDYFPVGLYVNTERHFYSKNVTMYKKLMYDLFVLYYGRLQIVLEKSLNLKLNYHDNLHYPGFHISNGNPMLMPNFHTDGFYNFYEYLSKKESLFFRQPMYLSVIVIIDTLKNDSGLLVRTNPKILDKNSLEYDHYYEYKKGMLAVWPGNLVHSVKPFTPLTKDDVRITMQCHIAINSSKGIIFW